MNGNKQRKRGSSNDEIEEKCFDSTAEVKRFRLPVAVMEVCEDEGSMITSQQDEIAPQPIEDEAMEDISEPSMKVSVKFLSGKVLTFDMKPSDTTETLKNLIDENMGIALHHQGLVYKAKLLQDHRTLRDYCIEDGSTITFHWRMGARRPTERRME